MRRKTHFREQDFFKGRWWDGLGYAILDHEWRTRLPSAAFRRDRQRTTLIRKDD